MIYLFAFFVLVTGVAFYTTPEFKSTNKGILDALLIGWLFLPVMILKKLAK